MTTFKIPKTIGACADRLYKIKELRADISKQDKLLEEEAKAIKEHIILTLPKSEATGVAGKLARVAVVTKLVPQVEDWTAFWAKFNKKTDTDMLARSINKTAVEARLDAGKKIPGIAMFNATSVSLNKV